MFSKAKSSRILVRAVLTLLVLLLCGSALAAASEVPVAAAPEGPARPSHPGGPGLAVSLKGDAANGAVLFKAVCARCHGPEGTDKVPNPGSTDGTVPPLNPVDPTIAGSSEQEFAINSDLFLEHGSRPDGPKPELEMPAWGDTKALAPQQIADLITYVRHLNREARGGAPSSR